MDQKMIDTMTRTARAWLAQYDANKDGVSMRDPLPCECQGCGDVRQRDAMVENSGRGYLCVECADKEIRHYRKLLMNAGLLKEKDIKALAGYPYRT